MESRTAGLPGTPAGEFLESVRRALGREPGPPAPPYAPLEETEADLAVRGDHYKTGEKQAESKVKMSVNKSAMVKSYK